MDTHDNETVYIIGRGVLLDTEVDLALSDYISYRHLTVYTLPEKWAFYYMDVRASVG